MSRLLHYCVFGVFCVIVHQAFITSAIPTPFKDKTDDDHTKLHRLEKIVHEHEVMFKQITDLLTGHQMDAQSFQAASETLALYKIRESGDQRPLSVIDDSLKPPVHVFSDCVDAYKKGWKKTGLYLVNRAEGSGSEVALCDHDQPGGGWRVIQQRLDGSVDFYRGWKEYQQGFGDVSGEFWMGLEKMRRLTMDLKQKLRITMIDKDGEDAHADYDEFWISPESSNYTLHVGTFNGWKAGDALKHHHNRQFSTFDHNNGDASAVNYHGAWWYYQGYHANLNSQYRENSLKGITWSPWSGHDKYDIRYVRMMIRNVMF